MVESDMLKVGGHGGSSGFGQAAEPVEARLANRQADAIPAKASRRAAGCSISHTTRHSTTITPRPPTFNITRGGLVRDFLFS